MRFGMGGRSSNVEDRRGLGGRAGMGIGGTVVLLVLSLIFGRDFISGTGADTGISATSNGGLSPADSAREEPEVVFVGQVLDDAQHTWANVLPKYGTQYRDAKLVLFRDATETGCGVGQSAMGPFYCPLDEKVYIDLGFYDELKTKFGASGDFAQAYVIAHELGHHVQHLLGTDEQVRRAMQRDPSAANQYSVRLELQADCFAGVWGRSTEQRKLLDEGDIQEGMNAAASVGDDRILQKAGRNANADSFTHGSAAQRMSWFKKGYDSGDPRACDTFAGA
ncbi:MAG TPA: neutral zinc metallopeptidase [Gemmatimonadaceae bacterium]|nr:neutral zinc metallopeptidase [Gemmatimonadaceae bacterium]